MTRIRPPVPSASWILALVLSAVTVVPGLPAAAQVSA